MLTPGNLFARWKPCRVVLATDGHLHCVQGEKLVWSAHLANTTVEAKGALEFEVVEDRTNFLGFATTFRVLLRVEPQASLGVAAWVQAVAKARDRLFSAKRPGAAAAAAAQDAPPAS